VSLRNPAGQKEESLKEVEKKSLSEIEDQRTLKSVMMPAIGPDLINISAFFTVA
jgi:hypothetical protein